MPSDLYIYIVAAICEMFIRNYNETERNEITKFSIQQQEHNDIYYRETTPIQQGATTLPFYYLPCGQLLYIVLFAPEYPRKFNFHIIKPTNN